ncbi:MAG: hypothetical protein WAP55_01185 [Minisyncoccia bacterium]
MIDRTKAKQFQVWVPDDLVGFIDERCGQTHLTRQGVLIEALRFYKWAIDERKQPGRRVGSFDETATNTREFFLPSP